MLGGCYSPQQDLLEPSEGLHPSEPEHKASPEVTRPTAPGAQRGTGCGVVSRGWRFRDTRSAGKPKATIYSLQNCSSPSRAKRHKTMFVINSGDRNLNRERTNCLLNRGVLL